MSIVRAKTNPYGPATLDIQLEQGADFRLKFKVKDKNTGDPLPLTGAVFVCHMQSSTPVTSCVNFTVEETDLANGEFNVVFPAASTLLAPFLNLPLPDDVRPIAPDKYPMGGWILHWTLGGVTTRYVEGTVYLDRDPCLM